MDEEQQQQAKKEEDEKRKKKAGIIDDANSALSKGKNAYQVFRKVNTVARAGGLLSSFGPGIGILIIILLFVGLIMSLVGGGGTSGLSAPTCETLTATPSAIFAGDTTTLTAANCSTTDIAYNWLPPATGTTVGNGATATYTAPAVVPATATVVQTLEVCNPQSTSLCTTYTINITINPGDSPFTCTNVPSQYCASFQCRARGPGTDVGVGECPTGTNCCRPALACGTIDQRLRDDFGIIIKEISEIVLCPIREKIYDIYSIPTQSLTYTRYLNPAVPFTLEFYQGSNPNGASGYTPSGYVIQLWGYANFLTRYPTLQNGGFLLLHETGHLIRDRNFTTFYYNFPYNSLLAGDSSCFNSCRVLKTYSLCPGPLISKYSEVFAELNPLYDYNKSLTNSPIYNFKGECPNSYNYIRQALYGGTNITP